MKPQFFFLLLIFLKYSCIIGKWKIKDDKNGKKEESLFLTSSYVISSQNISILFSDDSKCNAIIKENIHYYLSNGKFSDLTRRVTLKPNIEDFRNIVVSSKF